MKTCSKNYDQRISTADHPEKREPIEEPVPFLLLPSEMILYTLPQSQVESGTFLNLLSEPQYPIRTVLPSRRMPHSPKASLISMILYHMVEVANANLFLFHSLKN